MMEIRDLVDREIRKFCFDFVERPYLCYTEHGIHALFYHQLYMAIERDGRNPVVRWSGPDICAVQKEYATATNLGKSKRQTWDISVIKDPAKPIPDTETMKVTEYDSLRLAAVVEFGLNEPWKHLKGDLERLDDDGANMDHGFAVHLYRIGRTSRRNLSPGSRELRGCTRSIIEDKAEEGLLPKESKITIYYAVSNPQKLSSKKGQEPWEPGVWKLVDGEMKKMP